MHSYKIKGAVDADRRAPRVQAATLAHMRAPVLAKPQRIPEGGAVIRSAVPTNDCGGAIDSALRCRLRSSEGAGWRAAAL